MLLCASTVVATLVGLHYSNTAVQDDQLFSFYVIKICCTCTSDSGAADALPEN